MNFKIEILNPLSPEILARIQDKRQGTHTSISDMTREEIKEKYDIDIPDDKYFTPSIEDIRIGYELEFITNGKDYQKATVGTGKFIDEAINNGYRVPYLNKEQIEAEGWKHDGKNYDGGSFDKRTEKYVARIDYEYNTRQMKLYYTDESREYLDVRFEGECKDINTFRYICKLLGI